MGTDMDHLEEIPKLADELQAYIEHQLPVANPAALAKVRNLCIRMKGADHYINEKAGNIESLAGQYFSARKHAKYPGGAFNLRDEIVHRLLPRIRMQVENLRGLP
jgi:hypothetical protein